MSRVQERLIDQVLPTFGREEELQTLERALAEAGDIPKNIFLRGLTGLGMVKLIELVFSQDYCWFGFSKFTRREERKEEDPYTEISRSLTQIVTQILLLPNREDVTVKLRGNLTVSNFEELIKFCPDMERLEMYHPTERLLAYKARAVSKFLRRGKCNRGNTYSVFERFEYVNVTTIITHNSI